MALNTYGRKTICEIWHGRGSPANDGLSSVQFEGDFQRIRCQSGEEHGQPSINHSERTEGIGMGAVMEEQHQPSVSALTPAASGDVHE
jgi:hypothetical protein